MTLSKHLFRFSLIELKGTHFQGNAIRIEAYDKRRKCSVFIFTLVVEETFISLNFSPCSSASLASYFIDTYLSL